MVLRCLGKPTACGLPSHQLPTACLLLVLQVCVILFQQLHYYDTPSLVRALRDGRWHEALGGKRQVQLASDAW